MKTLFRPLLALLLAAAAPLQAAVQGKTLEYKDGDTVLRGQLYWDDRYEDPRPGVLVVHEWWGLNAYAKLRARMLAESGYVAFAPDMYGDNRVTEHAPEAKGWMEQITANLPAWQARAKAGRFRAVWSDFRFAGGGDVIELPMETAECLRLAGGERVYALPFARHVRM